MNISKQLKNYRKELNISQEELAEVVHVSRQTISNWENNKSYPDIQSLVLLSEYFKISLDELVKGDIVNMKNELERNEMLKFTKGMIIGFVLMILSLSVAKRFPKFGMILTFIFMGIMLWSAFKVEKIKKDKNIQTYKQIVDYMEGKEVIEEKNKSNKIKIISGLVSALITVILCYLVINYL